MPTSRSFRAYGLGLFAMVFCVNAPASLFELFRRRMELGLDHLALLYSVYSGVIIVLLPVAGRVSDRLGRRASVSAGLALVAAGCVTIAACDSFAGLLVGRLMQGVAVAAMSAPTAAALAELAPAGSPVGALAATLAMAFGGALGPLFSGVVAELSSAPQMISMCSAAALAALAAAGVCAVAAPPIRHSVASTTAAGGARHGAPFWQACGAVILAFGVQSTFFVVSGPRFAAFMASHVFLATGVAMAVFMSASGVGMVIGRRVPATSSVAMGVALLPVGTCAFFALVASAPFVAVLGTVLLAGAGHGLAYVGALRRINETAPNDRRGAYTSLFYVALYVGGGGPVLAIGALARQIGLPAASAAFSVVSCLGAAALLRSLRRAAPAEVARPEH